MLDDLKYIHTKDAQDALGIAAKQPEQLLHDFKVTSPKGPFANVVYAGMGGSALAAHLGTVWPGYQVPFEIVRGYDIPTYVGKDTLFIACSYSGNTEETVSALAEAEKTKATIVVIAGGGKLEEIATKNGHTFVRLPKAEQPRYAVLYNLKALLQILENSNVLNAKVSAKELKSTAQFLEEATQAWLPTVTSKKNPAKKLALEMAGKSLVIYGGPILAPAAYKWKISANENAKNVAWTGYYPEFNHNEFIGWSSHPVHKSYIVIDLTSSFDNPRIKKRFALSAKLLSGKRPEPHVIVAQGETVAQQLLWTVLLGDFATLYLGLLNGLNPAPVELVERLKKELG